MDPDWQEQNDTMKFKRRFEVFMDWTPESGNDNFINALSANISEFFGESAASLSIEARESLRTRVHAKIDQWFNILPEEAERIQRISESRNIIESFFAETDLTNKIFELFSSLGKEPSQEQLDNFKISYNMIIASTLGTSSKQEAVLSACEDLEYENNEKYVFPNDRRSRFAYWAFSYTGIENGEWTLYKQRLFMKSFQKLFP